MQNIPNGESFLEAPVFGPKQANPKAPDASPASMRDHAVALARQGFRVFKLLIGGKTPAAAGWPQTASSDPDAVHQMWTCPVSGESLDNNIGIATGDGLVVLDVDVKADKAGLQSLAVLEDLGLQRSSFEVRTPSGGLHLYYVTDPDAFIPNSTSKLAPGIDVRGHHGYVVAPGSVTQGGAYVLAAN